MHMYGHASRLRRSYARRCTAVPGISACLSACTVPSVTCGRRHSVSARSPRCVAAMTARLASVSASSSDTSRSRSLTWRQSALSVLSSSPLRGKRNTSSRSATQQLGESEQVRQRQCRQASGRVLQMRLSALFFATLHGETTLHALQAGQHAQAALRAARRAVLQAQAAQRRQPQQRRCMPHVADVQVGQGGRTRRHPRRPPAALQRGW